MHRKVLLLFLLGCSAPDPASEIAAILSKHPAAFTEKMIALEALVARHFPPLDPASVVMADTLMRYRARLLQAGFAGLPDSLKADALIRFLFDSLGLKSEDSAGDLALSQPGQSLKNRRGSCVGLALVALALAETVRLDARPVFLPGHLFIRLRVGPEAWRNVELLRRGITRSDSFYRETFRLAQRPWYTLASASPKQVLAALAFNLANAHAAAGKTGWAREEYRRVAEQIPGFPDALGGEGAMLLAEGRGAEALSRLEESIAGDSLSFPAWDAYAKALKRAGRGAAAEEARKRAENLNP